MKLLTNIYAPVCRIVDASIVVNKYANRSVMQKVRRAIGLHTFNTRTLERIMNARLKQGVDL